MRSILLGLGGFVVALIAYTPFWLPWWLQRNARASAPSTDLRKYSATFKMRSGAVLVVETDVLGAAYAAAYRKSREMRA